MPSSGYTLWSVVAGEQPTTAKWNILGNNDAAFNTGVGFNDSAVINRHLAINAITSGIKTTAAEGSYTGGSWTQIPGLSISVTTTKANQVVAVFSTMQTYTGGYSQFRYQVDGAFVGDSSKYQTGVNSTTTGAYTFIDWFTISTAGTHTITCWANAGTTGLRIIHGEGTGRMIAFIA